MLKDLRNGISAGGIDDHHVADQILGKRGDPRGPDEIEAASDDLLEIRRAKGSEASQQAVEDDAHRPHVDHFGVGADA